MRGAHRSVLSIVALLAVAGCGGSSSGEERVETPEEKPKTRVTMITSDRGEGPRRATTLFGEVMPVPADRKVVLYADVHPFGKYRRARTVRVQRDGDYRVRVRPRRDTRYRVGAGSARSRPEKLHAYLRKKLDIDQVGSQFHAVMTWTGPPPVRPRPGARVYVYAAPAGDNVLDRVGSAKVVPAGRGRLTASLSFTPPAYGTRISTLACMRRFVARGFGGLVVIRRCGGPKIHDVRRPRRGPGADRG